MDIPCATYRLQLSGRFSLGDTAALADYFDQLGISHLHLSPILAAKEESLSGYDVVDHTLVNQELGGEDGLKTLALTLKRCRMGMIVDIVPNHMYIATEKNSLWQDLLRNGSASPYSHYFDVDWEAMNGKMLLPFLENPLEEELAAGNFKLVKEGDSYYISYYDSKYPVDPDSLSFLDDMPSLLRKQHYRLDHWRKAASELNYRRFFDISELAGLRMEEPSLFDHVHQLLRRWCEMEIIAGVRVDHIDGLRDPADYCRKLKALVNNRYVVVEKILLSEERLNSRWHIEGTTGYDALNLLNGLFIHPQKMECLVKAYTDFIGDTTSIDEQLLQCKETVLRTTMMSEVNSLARKLAPFFCAEPLPWDQLVEGLIALLIAMLVYRTYFDGSTKRSEDVAVIEDALRNAEKKCGNRVPAAFWKGAKGLFLEENTQNAIDFVLTFQQSTGAIMAKGLEDTFNYRYFPLASANEVGSWPGEWAVSPAKFHAKNKERLNSWPCTMVATTTHDTKRSEDVRARLNVLSEIPRFWDKTLQEWHLANREAAAKEGPDKNDEYLLYQTIVGTWPIPWREEEREGYTERIIAYMIKAVRESKRKSSWIDPDRSYENEVESFIRRVISKEFSFGGKVEIFLEGIVSASYYNGLAQLLFKGTIPGVPDFYQGSELWLHTLVDPDNRGQVDFSVRRGMLSKVGMLRTLPFSAEDFESGFVKLYVTERLLRCRKIHEALFRSGDYIPLAVEGVQCDRVVAYARKQGDKVIIAAAGRWLMELENPLGEVWEGTVLVLGELLELSREYFDHFTGGKVAVRGSHLALEKVFQQMPLALLESIPDKGQGINK